MKSRRWVRLGVEVLESRVVPSTVAPPTPPAPYKLWNSSNWSGIDLDTTKGAVTAVSGSWIVPAVPATDTGTGYSSAWVGIDGDLSGTVEQIGTESDTAATAKHDGTPQYYAWYEMYPANYYNTTPDTVSPGDQITASVVYEGQTKSGTKTNDNFQLTITDSTNSTQNWTFTTTQSVPSHVIAQRTSAEWIQEAPSGNGVLPLSNFGSITFTNAQATISGATGTIASFVGKPSIVNYGTAKTPLEINVMDIGTESRSGQWTSIEDETSLLSSSGNSFTVQFGSSNPAAPSASPNTKALDDRMASLQAMSSTTLELAHSLASNASGSTVRNLFVAGETQPTAATFGVPITVATQAQSVFLTDRSAVLALGNLTDAALETGAGIGGGPGNAALATTGSLWSAFQAGDGNWGTFDPTAAVITGAWETPQIADFGAPDEQLPPYALDGSVDRSAAALVFLLGLAHGWNPAAITDEQATRRQARRRLAQHSRLR